MTRIEFAAMSDAALRKLDTDTNGLSEAKFELRRRGLVERTGSGRTPADRLRELERIGPYGPMSAEERELRTMALYRGRNPHFCVLAAHATRILGGW